MIHLICLQYLKTHLSPWNVLDTYAFAEQYGEVHILYQCLRLIDKNAGYVFASPGFNSLPMRLVKALAGRTTLSAREVPVPDRSDIRAFSTFFTLQSWAKGWTCFAKQQPGRARLNFSHPRDHLLAHLCNAFSVM